MVDSYPEIMLNAKGDKNYGDYLSCKFIKKNLIKTKFTIAHPSSEQSPLPSTRGDVSPRRFANWGWNNNEIEHSFEDEGHETKTPMAKKAKKILQMVDKPMNIGVTPIDGSDPDIYSLTTPVNVYSFIAKPKKYDKKKPPPTYLEYNEYKEAIKKAIHMPMKDLEVRQDLGRIECVNQETNNNNKGLKSYMMKQVAKNFWKGVTSFSLPAYAFDPESNVSQFMNNFRTAPKYLKMAHQVDLESDPYERIKLITAMAVSSLHQNISFKRAFNPILGETYEGYMIDDCDEDTFGESQARARRQTASFYTKKMTKVAIKSQPTNLRSKFINIYVEQTSHHPPISNFMLEHIDGIYKIYGYYEEIFNQGKSAHEFRTKGPTYIEFKDDKYLLTWAPKKLENNCFMYYDEYLKVEQIGTDLTSVVFLNDPNTNGLDIKGLIFNKDPETEIDSNAKSDEDLRNIAEVIADIEGNWVESCIIDGKIYWEQTSDKLNANLPVSNPLPSD